jgi:hypothetical protein
MNRYDVFFDHMENFNWWCINFMTQLMILGLCVEYVELNLVSNQTRFQFSFKNIEIERFV